MGALDHATANLLQMSVPDPSTTFLDIGPELGGQSLYEDDPFNLDHLLPSTFNINQLDMIQSSPDAAHNFQNNNNNQQILIAHGAETSMAITAKALMENNNVGHNLSIHGGHSGGQNSGGHPGNSGGHPGYPPHHPHGIGMNLYPETTISPMTAPPPGKVSQPDTFILSSNVYQTGFSK